MDKVKYNQLRRLSAKDAYKKLPEDEKEVIGRYAGNIVDATKAKNPRVGMSEDGALELLAAIGQYFRRHGVKEIKQVRK